jgi:hypothetical protein
VHKLESGYSKYENEESHQQKRILASAKISNKDFEFLNAPTRYRLVVFFDGVFVERSLSWKNRAPNWNRIRTKDVINSKVF